MGIDVFTLTFRGSRMVAAGGTANDTADDPVATLRRIDPTGLDWGTHHGN